jgi:hypothetical protein
VINELASAENGVGTFARAPGRCAVGPLVSFPRSGLSD